ncbi:STAS domain-containing protein (plasmid) [Priestia megaterium]|uniref:STAS domain-containing protein n=1 Tax=Priestia megaterium TaxID=1404 RepID=UPI000BF35D4A|nr:STAS domain-containing protein [Priestia megaterium]MDH2449394.1 STAS domain-containing protein [Priestia megaterium]MDL5148852.1 STAS domain-containing protein [Priestia megaterium]MED3869766.1 STAS domain-containing protein [Priestia megaterium]PEU54334.1 anti-anti-sigma factor [Priestia megaterium]PFP34330.1 anti-anti-sigma factor [Priestia megaterium]
MEDVLLNKKLQRITAVILHKKKELAEQKRHYHFYNHDVYVQLVPWRKNLIEIYAESISIDEEHTFQILEQWGIEVANLLTALQLPLDIALEEISYYRNQIGEIITQEAKKENFSFDLFSKVISRYNLVVDKAVHWVSKSYMKDYIDKIQSAQYAIDELSIPVVRVTKEIGVIPLVGEIDTHRAQILMENALKQGNTYRLSWLIIDLSAVPIIDTMVADQLFKVVAALKLIGIDVVLSGIRSEIALTMVQLGVKLNDIVTFNTLYGALEYTSSRVK